MTCRLYSDALSCAGINKRVAACAPSQEKSVLWLLGDGVEAVTNIL